MLVSTVLLMGVIDLLTLPGWVDQTYVWEVPLEASWGSLFTFLLGGAYAWVAWRPRAPWPALVLLAVCALALGVSAGAGLDWRPLALAVGVAVSGRVLWGLAGQPPPPAPRLSPRWPALVVAALGVPLWSPYALDAFAQSRAGVLGSVTQGIEHWPVQGALGVAVVLSALLLAVWDDGRPLMRVAVSLSGVYVGMAELAYPDRSGAMGSLLWGVGVTLWGLLVALTAVPEGVRPGPRRESPASEHPVSEHPTPVR